MKKILLFLFFLLMSVGSAFGIENDTHDFTQSISQLLNNNASISSINISDQGYPIKSIIITCRYNKSIANAVTINVKIDGTNFASDQTAGNNFNGTKTFNGDASGNVSINFTNNTGSGTGHGTFYVTNVRLVEGASTSYTIHFKDSLNKQYFDSIDASSVILPTPAPTSICSSFGWEFAGWSESKTNFSDLKTGTYIPTQETILYAVYRNGSEATSYTLDYSEETRLASSTSWGSYGTAYTYTANDGGVWVIKGYKNAGIQINKSKDASVKIPNCPENITSIEITGKQSAAVGLSASDYTGSGTITYIAYGTDATSQTLDLTGESVTGGYIVPKTGNFVITKIVVNYGEGAEYSLNPTCQIVDVVGVTLNESAISIYTNEEYQLEETILPSNATDKGVTWASENTDIATVDENGLVIGIAEGVTTVTCTTNDGGFIATCTVTVLGKPLIDIMKWDTNAVYIDIDNFEAVTAVLENQNTQAEINQHFADSLFFSKYFEAASNVKLIGIYNGTDHDIDIADYGYAKATNGGAFTTTLFSAFVRHDGESFNTIIESNHEMILIAYHDDDKSDSVIIKCAQDNLNSGYESYIRISTPAIDFNGDDAIALVNPEGNFIDLIGAGTQADGSVKGADFRSCNKSGASGGDCDGFMDTPGGWFSEDGINLHTNDSNYSLATNRCLLVRKKSVTSGLNAVSRNTTTFSTLGGVYGEWRGVQMPGGSPNTADGEGTRNSCAGFDDVGTFDYNDYYIDYDTIVSEQSLPAKEEDGTYKIEISQLDTLSCTNLKVIVKDGKGHTTYEVFKIPIMVAEDINTKSELFRKEKTDCPTCDVVIMHNAKLTVDSTMTNRNLKVYEGSRLDINSELTYTLTSLSLRKTDDTNPYLTLKGNISLAGDSSFYLDVYTDPSEWRWLALPDTFDIRNITLSNGKKVTFNVDYLIKTYSGYVRATQQKNGWVTVFPNKQFMPGEGFIFGIAGSGTIKKEFRFKFANNILTKEKANKTLRWNDLQSWGGGNSELRPNHKGWNLIGNAFLDLIDTELYDPIGIGKLVHSDTEPWDGKWEVDPESTGKLRYRVIHERNSAGEDGNGYSSELLDDVQLEPFSTFFIQLGGESQDHQEISLKTSKRRNMMRRMIMTDDEDDELFLRVFVGNKKTGMFISNKFTEDYEPGDDLESRQTIYQNIGGYRLLYSAIPDSTMEKGVLINAQSGKLFLDEKVNINNFEYIYVKYGNSWYNLLQGETVDIETGTFILQAKRKNNDIPTGLDAIPTKGIYKFTDGKYIYINRNGELINVLGNKIK